MVVFSKLSNLTPREIGIIKKVGLAIVAIGGSYKLLKSDDNNNNKRKSKDDEKTNDEEENKKKRRKRSTVNKEFFEKLMKLVKIVVPKFWCKEIGLLSIFTVLLVGRTFLSIKISEVNGGIVKSIVERKFTVFLRRIATLGGIAVPASAVNSSLKYLNKMLALYFRQRLVKHFHGLYLQPMMYYKVLNLDSRITNPDHALTETIDKWTKSISDLYSNVTKPLLDIVLFSHKLSKLLGPQGPISVILYYFLSGVLIRLISPRFGKLIAKKQNLEARFRSQHHKIITHAEEIAFYGGHDFEKNTLAEKFDDVVKHTSKMSEKYLFQGVFDGFLVKYGAVMLGYAVLGLPVFGPGSENYIKEIGDSSAMITHDYIRNSSLLINLAKAIGRIVTSYKELQELTGYTSLVSELGQVLDDLNTGKYNRKMVQSEKLKKYTAGSGEFYDNEDIVFEDVPVITPNGDILAEHVSFTIKQGQNLMVVGPNGCGKSSLFRILKGLWPIFGGKIGKPIGGLFYIPQKPYLTATTLRDQVIYPDTIEEMKEKGYDDAGLEDLLTQVKLNKIVAREGGWDKRQDWKDVLSGGEKQRIAMARLFYHAPKFAILDECTSAVSVDVEKYMYTHAKEIGTTLLTISHRQTLWQYHDVVLRFDGRGSWSFDKLQEGEGAREEKRMLNLHINDVN